MTIRYPDKLCLALVDTCNLKCISCYSWKNKYKADPALDTALQSFLTDFRKQVSLPYMVNFSGGETLINPKLAETIKYCKELGFETQVTSNVTFLNEDYIDKLKESGLDVLSLPLEGISKEVHDRIRPWQQSHFEMVHHRLQNLEQAFPDLRVHVNTIICNPNIHELLALSDFVREHGYLKGIFFNIIVQPFHTQYEIDWSRGELNEDDLWPADIEAAVQVVKELRRRKDFGYPIDNNALQFETFERLLQTPTEEVQKNCPVIDHAWIVKSDGGLHSCQYFKPMGNIKEGPLEQILDSPGYLEHRQSMESCTRNCHLALNCFWKES